MKKKWQHIVVTFLTAIMLTNVVGCGQKDDSQDVSSGGDSSKSGITEFTMFTAMPGAEINNDNDIMNLIAEKTGVKVKETWLTGQTDAEAIGTILLVMIILILLMEAKQ